MRQFLYTSLILELLLLTLLFTSSVVSKTRGRKKIFKEVNICIQDLHSPVFCHCNNNGPRNASDINCLILNELKQTDPLWDYFILQTHLEKLMLTVRPPGKLEFIPRQLQKLKNLHAITISFGRFHDLNQRIFNNSGITEIHLNEDMIFALHKYTFMDMRNLTLVDLDKNHISEIKRYE